MANGAVTLGTRFFRPGLVAGGAVLDSEGPLRKLRLNLVGKGRAVGGVDHAAVPKMRVAELFRFAGENSQDVRLSGDRMGEGHRLSRPGYGEPGPRDILRAPLQAEPEITDMEGLLPGGPGKGRAVDGPPIAPVQAVVVQDQLHLRAGGLLGPLTGDRGPEGAAPVLLPEDLAVEDGGDRCI